MIGCLVATRAPLADRMEELLERADGPSAEFQH